MGAGRVVLAPARRQTGNQRRDTDIPTGRHTRSHTESHVLPCSHSVHWDTTPSDTPRRTHSHSSVCPVCRNTATPACTASPMHPATPAQIAPPGPGEAHRRSQALSGWQTRPSENTMDSSTARHTWGHTLHIQKKFHTWAHMGTGLRGPTPAQLRRLLPLYGAPAGRSVTWGGVETGSHAELHPQLHTRRGSAEMVTLTQMGGLTPARLTPARARWCKHCGMRDGLTQSSGVTHVQTGGAGLTCTPRGSHERPATQRQAHARAHPHAHTNASPPSASSEVRGGIPLSSVGSGQVLLGLQQSRTPVAPGPAVARKGRLYGSRP